MTAATNEKINRYCVDYGDKPVELMEQCNVINIEVPEEEALRYLHELEDRYGKSR